MTTQSWRIRPAFANDARQIARIYVASWRRAYRGILPDRVLDGMSVDLEARAFRAGLAERRRGHAAFVLDQPGVPPIGFVSVGPERGGHAAPSRRGEIYTLYLLPVRQRRGLGRRLMAEAAVQLMADGYAGAVVWVLRDNAARGFYRAMGGVTEGTRGFRVGGEDVPAVSYAWPDLAILEERAAGLSALALPPSLPGGGFHR